MAVLPDLNSKLCSEQITETESYANHTLSEGMQQLRRILCLILFLFSLVLLIPSAVIYLQQEGKEYRATSFTLLIILIILFIATWYYTLICQLKCCYFIRRSAKTGFSLSKTHELHPSSISSTEKRMEAIPTMP